MRLLFAMIFSLSMLAVTAQQDITEPVSRALGRGDVAVLGRYMVASVDLTILDDEDMYPRDVVMLKLDQFFVKNRPLKFELKHQGTSKLDDHYRIGDLTTEGGVYRVTFFMKNASKGMEIKQMRVERFE